MGQDKRWQAPSIASRRHVQIEGDDDAAIRARHSEFTVELTSPQFPVFLTALENRHLADLRFSDVTRSLRALSSAYVERRESALADHKALDGAGKRAAFALYYGPLHFLLIQHIIKAIGASFAPGTVVDLGCGTGVAGAAIATSTTPPPRVLGVDTHPWTLDEARFTYKSFRVQFDVRRAHAAKTRFPSDTSVVVAAFVVNELKDADRAQLLQHVIRLKADTTSSAINKNEALFMADDRRRARPA